LGRFACAGLTRINRCDTARALRLNLQQNEFFHLKLLTVGFFVDAPYPEDRSNGPAIFDSPLKLFAENATGATPGNGLCCLRRVARHPDGDPHHIALVAVFRNEAAGAGAAPRATRVIRTRGTIGRRKNVLIGVG